MRVGVVGINHKLAGLHLRETLSRACQKRFNPEGSTHGSHAFVLLSTCNRMELYFSSDDLAETHSYILHVLKQEVEEDFDQKLYSYFGEECFHHLCAVAAGFDSAITGETEIQGQVKSAYEATLGSSILPSPLHYLFQKGLKISKEIRSKYALGRGMPNIEHAIFQTGSQFFDTPEKSSILVIGASEINHKVLEHLQRKGCESITLCNRTHEKGESLARKFQIPFLPWAELNRWHSFDWIVLGTKAKNHLLKQEMLPKDCTSKKLIFDLSFPRNVEPLLGRDDRIKLLNIDQINEMLKFRRRLLEKTLMDAGQEIKQSVQKQTEIYAARRHNFAFHVA